MAVPVETAPGPQTERLKVAFGQADGGKSRTFRHACTWLRQQGLCCGFLSDAVGQGRLVWKEGKLLFGRSSPVTLARNTQASLPADHMGTEWEGKDMKSPGLRARVPGSALTQVMLQKEPEQLGVAQGTAKGRYISLEM